MKIVFLIRSLGLGGAERQVVTLVKGLKELGGNVSVVVFYSGGKFEHELKKAGILVSSLEKTGRWDIFAFWRELISSLRSQRADVLHSYLPVGNIFAVLAKPFLGGTRVVWAIAASNVDLSCYDRVTRWTYWLEARLARFADLIISNSQAGAYHAVKRGFPECKMTVFPNGQDADEFRPDTEGRRRVRREWSLGAEDTIIGLVARMDPMKDHQCFIEAASILGKERNDIRFVCIGDGSSSYQMEMMELTRQFGVADRFVWAGSRQDMPAVYSALDINTCSSSFGEGLPNAIGEAMSCGTPCVVTDVGDCALIVGDAGVVVPARSPGSLAAGWQKLLNRLDAEGDAVGEMARKRIMDQFSKRRVVERTDAAFKHLLSATGQDN